MNLFLKVAKKIETSPTSVRGLSKSHTLGFTLPEVVISVAIAALCIGGIIYGYVISARRAEWSGYSLAAHTAAIQVIERIRSARWDPTANPPVDLVTSNQFPVTESLLLDIPVQGTNVVSVSARTTISTISVNPPLKMIEVECTWPFSNGRTYTNKVVTYRSPGS